MILLESLNSLNIITFSFNHKKKKEQDTLKIQKEFFEQYTYFPFLHTFTKSHPLRKSCLVSVRFKRISCIDIERSLQRGPRGLPRESRKMVEEFPAERQARTGASRYSVYRLFVRWEWRITWQNIFFLSFVYSNVERIGLFTRDVGSIYKNMSQRLKMEQDVQEKERMMIGLTGCLDKDILKRFVRQRFILIANRQQLSFDDWRPLCYFVACRCPICRSRVGFMAFLERKFIDICEIRNKESYEIFGFYLLFKIFESSLNFQINIFLVSKETINPSIFLFDFLDISRKHWMRNLFVSKILPRCWSRLPWILWEWTLPGIS